MPRIRTVKPEFFKHFDLFSLEKEHKLPIRLSFQGLWICADKEGRFKWQPMQLKLDILPYDEVDFEKIMSILDTARFVIKYTAEGKEYGYIPSFKDHQRITGSEALSDSKIPPPKIGKNKETIRKQRGNAEASTRTTGREGKGKGKEEEGKGIVGFFPDQNFQIEISDFEIGKAIEYLTITKHVKADASLVKSIWETFKIKNFTGEKFYKNERGIISHFFESLKFQQLNGTGAHQQVSASGGGKLGTSEARVKKASEW